MTRAVLGRIEIPQCSTSWWTDVCYPLARKHGRHRVVKRRNFIMLLGGTAAAWPIAARAQQGERMRRIGMLAAIAADEPEAQARNASFLQRLGELGWTVGRNVRVDYRLSADNADDIRRYATELVALAPDVILATSGANRGGITTGKSLRANRVRGNYRSGRQRLR